MIRALFFIYFYFISFDEDRRLEDRRLGFGIFSGEAGFGQGAGIFGGKNARGLKKRSDFLRGRGETAEGAAPLPYLFACFH
ncbi:MAG: hypothetical protein IPO35_17845 [Uliginosibacterium sp.]|nr:hypothetical protein [Uliginosibacterium sp.]